MNLLMLAAQAKVYFSRATTYLSILNFVLIVANFKALYDINISIYVIGPLGMIGILIIGYIDYLLIQKKETEYINKQHDLKDSLDRIEQKLKEGETK